MRKNASYSAEQLIVLVTSHIIRASGIQHLFLRLWSRLNSSTKIGSQELTKMPNFIENISLDQDGIIYSITHKISEQEWPEENTYIT